MRDITYRTELLLVLLSLVLVSTGLFATASYRICNYLVRREVHRKAHSIASTTAVFLDPAAVATVARRGDEHKEQYAKIKKILIEVRQANRRRDAHVDHIFTLLRAPQDPQLAVYGVDTGEEFGTAHLPGEVYKIDGLPALGGIETIHRRDNELDNFEVGYDTGFAPICDDSGRLLAELGVKLGWAPNTMLGNIWRYVLPPFAITIALALIVAVWVSRNVTAPLYSLEATIREIGQGRLDVTARAQGTIEFLNMARAINLMTAGLREREMIEKAFSGYLSREVLELILREGKAPELKGERRYISVLFADIRNFTSLAETRRPEEVVEQLGEFFARMVSVVQRHNGYVDKFTGDGIMAVFGAPVQDPQHEEHAISAALEMQQELRRLCRTWDQQSGRSVFKMGIGVNSGSAVVGNIGSEAHMEYTAIGDTVNLASRLQTATKEMEADILVSAETYGPVRSRFSWKPLGSIQVRGRIEPVQIYGLHI